MGLADCHSSRLVCSPIQTFFTVHRMLATREFRELERVNDQCVTDCKFRVNLHAKAKLSVTIEGRSLSL